MEGSRLDEVLRHLGRYGRYQVICTILIATIGTWFPAWHLMGIIFTADSPQGYQCVTSAANPPPKPSAVLADVVESVTPTYQQWTENASVSMVTRNISMEVNECVLQGTDEPCREWQYLTKYNETTIVTDLNLICDRSFLAQTAQSIFLAGCLVGSFLFGFLSDAFGRKKMLLIGCLANGVFGILVAFVQNYPGFVTLWFLIGLFTQGYNQVQFIMVIEMFPPECRTLIGSLNNMFWGVGVITVTPFAYIFRNWRHMQLAISIPCLVAIPLWFILDDSIRWLISKGRINEATNILNKMARWNSVEPPPGGFLLAEDAEEENIALKEIDKSEVAAPSIKEKKSITYLDVLRSPRLLLNTVIIYFSWFVSMMTYYGASLNSAHLVGSKYANFFFLGLAEIPAFFIIHFTMTWWGRRPSMGLFFVVSGLTSIATAFIPMKTVDGADLTVPIVVMAIIAKLCITCAFSINLIFCSEIFPTPVRNVGFGIGAVVANIGTVVAPFILYLASYASFLPLTIFGALSISAAVLIPILPETRNKPLPETIEDAIHLGRTPPCTQDKDQREKSSSKLEAANDLL
ncbi:organic cation transporter protein-like [Asterias rubens]|uniref:organic cation transporter protein-like n=1 Tax=Asterias rubens TaxID=7604 RepID=UPI001455772D|nr:organic cation transporter protein-like [Asterias rubens]